MVQLKFYNAYEGLFKDELLAVLDVLNVTHNLTKSTPKSSICLKLEAEFQKLSYDIKDETKFYFIGDSAHKTVQCHKIEGIENDKFISGFDVQLYHRLRPRCRSNYLKILNEEIETMEKTKENENVVEIKDGEKDENQEPHISDDPYMAQMLELLKSMGRRDDQIQQLQDILVLNQMKPKVDTKVKVEYDEAQGVPHFVAQVEEWAAVNQEKNDNYIIRKAQAALLQSSNGLNIRNHLSVNPPKTWEEYKQRLYDIRGFDKEHYRQLFKNGRKEEYETYGEFLCRLTSNYRYANQITQISAHDEIEIKRQFIDNVPKYKKELMIEDYKGNITFKNVSKFAQQYELADQNSRDTINFIPAEKKPENAIQTQIDNLAKSVLELTKQFQTKNIISQPITRVKKMPTLEQMEKIKNQVCRKWESTGNCTFGEKCWRPHSKN